MNIVARALIESQAVHIQTNPEEFYTWTSGRRSPIYCDNRQLISYPQFRSEITKKFVDYIKDNFSDIELIAGTATAGISWAAWIADALELPMIYIRSKPKGHGMKSAIEGKISEGQNTLIIEDLISTGKSSFEAYEHCVNDKLNVQAVLSIFTYQFKEAAGKFSEKQVPYHSLCTLDKLLEYSKSTNALSEANVNMVKDWRDSF